MGLSPYLESSIVGDMTSFVIESCQSCGVSTCGWWWAQEREHAGVATVDRDVISHAISWFLDSGALELNHGSCTASLRASLRASRITRSVLQEMFA